MLPKSEKLPWSGLRMKISIFLRTFCIEYNFSKHFTNIVFIHFMQYHQEVIQRLLQHFSVIWLDFDCYLSLIFFFVQITIQIKRPSTPPLPPQVDIVWIIIEIDVCRVENINDNGKTIHGTMFKDNNTSRSNVILQQW